MESSDVLLGKVQTEIDGINKRLDKLEVVHDELKNLTIGVAKLTERQSATEKTLSDVAENVEEIKGRPGKRQETIVGILISVPLTAFLTYLVTMTLK